MNETFGKWRKQLSKFTFSQKGRKLNQNVNWLEVYVNELKFSFGMCVKEITFAVLEECAEFIQHSSCFRTCVKNSKFWLAWNMVYVNQQLWYFECVKIFSKFKFPGIYLNVAYEYSFLGNARNNINILVYQDLCVTIHQSIRNLAFAEMCYKFCQK